MTRSAVAWGLLILALTAPRWSEVRPFAVEIAAGFGSVRVPTALATAGSHALTLLVIGALWLACRGAGSSVLGVLASRGFAGSGWAGLAAGWGALATAAYGLALAGLYAPPPLVAMVLVAAGVRIAASRRAAGRPPGPGPAATWLALAGLPWLVAAPLLLAPMPYIDTYQYHLAAPERFLRAHRFSVEHANAGFRLPLTAELLNVLPVALDRDELAAAVSGLPFVAALGFGAGWLTRLAGPAAAGLTVGLVLALRPVLWVAMTGKNDLAAAGLGLLGMLAAARGMTPVSAAAFGLMAATKTNGLVFAGIAWLFHEGHRIMRRRTRWRPDLRWAAIAAVVPLSWWTKSWLIDGDPFWPALSARIGNPLWDAEREAAFRQFFRVEGGIAVIPAALWRALLTEAPGLLVVVPALAAGSLSAPLRRMAWQAAASLAACAFVVQYEFDRLMLPALAGLAFPAVAALAAPGRTAVALFACIAGWAPAAGTLALSYNRHAVEFLHGARSRADLRRTVHTTLDETREAAGTLRDVRTLILVNDNAAYRFPGRVATEAFHDRKPTWALTRDAGDLPRLLVRLRQMDASHLSVNVIREGLLTTGGAAYQFHVWSDRQLDLLVAFMRRHAEPVRIPPRCDHVNGAQYVWRISRTPVARSGPVHYLPGIQQVKARIYAPWLERRNYVACRDIALALCARYPDVLWFRAEAAFIAHLMDHQPATYHDYAMVLRHGYIGDHPLIFFAEAAAKTGHIEEAIAALRESAVVYPDQIPEAHRMLGIAHAMRAQQLVTAKRPAAALPHARTSVEYAPENPSCHAAVAHTLLALRRWDEAESIYRMLLERWPEDGQAQAISRANLAYILRAKAAGLRR